MSSTAYSAQASDLTSMLASTREALESTRSERESWRQRAETAEAKVTEYESRCAGKLVRSCMSGMQEVEEKLHIRCKDLRQCEAFDMVVKWRL